MPAPKDGKGGSSSAVITLVVLFLISATAAVVFYVKAEGVRTEAQAATQTLDKWVSRSERGSWVGEEKAGQTKIGAMIASFNEITRMSLGQVPAESSVDVKLKTIKDKFTEILADLSAKVDVFKGASADTDGMLSVLERMKDATAAATAAQSASQRRVSELSAENETLRKAGMEKEEQYALLVQKFAGDANTTQKNFGTLQAQMDQNTKDEVAMVQAKLTTSEEAVKTLQAQLKDAKAQLDVATQKLGIAQSELSKIVPAPDSEVAAFRPDGQIVSIDNKAGLVYVNLGAADKVYRGLTFAVYDKGIPIPRDGKGKALIVILEPKDRMSIARIAVSDPKKPVLVDDTIANLVWDSNKSRVFVVAGSFDLDNNGTPDADGSGKVKALIAKWGGTLSDEITPSTDFVVLGSEPKVPFKPSGEEVVANPSALKKYESALATQQAYQMVVTQAKTLSLPVFNLERLMYMTGYETMSPRGSTFSATTSQ
jgi:hypothetical protein